MHALKKVISRLIKTKEGKSVFSQRIDKSHIMTEGEVFDGGAFPIEDCLLVFPHFFFYLNLFYPIKISSRKIIRYIHRFIAKSK